MGGKRYLLISALCAFSFFGTMLSVHAQSTRVLISLNDASVQPTVFQQDGRVKVSFNNSDVSNIFSRYAVQKFERAYPSAAESYLRNIWKVEVSSANLVADLQNYSTQLFPYIKIENPGTPLYNTNDYGFAGNGTLQNELDLIRAKAAWDITKGDSSILIGITDTYFDTNNVDLIGKIARLRALGAASSHGTYVATIAAGGTDNGVGLSSIGFKCRLDLSANMYDDENLQMSADGDRIINGSWYNNCSYDLMQQGVYNSIYENGTVACFAAGNGSSTCSSATAYAYPAAYDHNLAVTSVGNQFPIGTNNYSYSGTTTGYSWFNVHNRIIGFPATDYSHYDKVDICAPGHGVSSGTYVASNPATQFQSYNAWGTSFSSPFVAGTAGLMFSANKALSPYQVEYILKKTAFKIDTIPQNVPYVGELGAGRLDAGAAVAMAASINVNDPAIASLYIVGIDISTKCLPTATSNGAKPMLKPTILNGTPPYTYNWEAIPGNAAILDAYNTPTPSVISLSYGSTVWYRLTVYDNSPIQKVASKVIKVDLSNTGNYDLSIRDSYNDMSNEFNNQDSIDSRDWNLWRSPDIWNRQQNDASTFHQPANYAAANNYVNVRIRNTGCQASPAPTTTTPQKLRVYWSFPSTSHKWPYDFSSAYTFTNAAGNSIPAGGEITTTPVAIPVIQPGQDTVIRIAWHPVNYAVAAPKAQEGNLSIYARISNYNSSNVDQGPGITETNRTPVNARNSNNLALNNLVKISIDSNTLVNSTAFYLTNPDSVQQTMNFRINALKDVYKYMSGDFKQLMTIRIYLGNLYSRWVSGGRQGKYLSYDDNLKYVSFEDISNASLNNISMNSGEHAFAVIEIGVKNLPFTYMAANLHEFMLTQYKVSNSERVGAITFQVYYNSSVNSPSSYRNDTTNTTSVAQVATQKPNTLSLYPNPVSNGIVYAVFNGTAIDKANIVVQDIMGRTVYMHNYDRVVPQQPIPVPVSDLANGVYYLRISGKGIQTQPAKFVVTAQ